MKFAWITVVVLALAVVSYAGGTGWWDIDDARMASKIEIKVDKNGMHQEIEYHIDPSFVPVEVRDAMTMKYPGLEHVGAEKEWEGGALYFELTVMVDGKKVETMFTAEGQLHSQEIEIDVAEVPAPVQAIIQAKYPTGTDLKWEIIKNPAGQITEYHVKLTEDGKHHKVIVTPGGSITGSYFEVVAELEVPAPPR